MIPTKLWPVKERYDRRRTGERGRVVASTSDDLLIGMVMTLRAVGEQFGFSEIMVRCRAEGPIRLGR